MKHQADVTGEILTRSEYKLTWIPMQTDCLGGLENVVFKCWEKFETDVRTKTIIAEVINEDCS